jgi:hypothetical protein
MESHLSNPNILIAPNKDIPKQEHINKFKTYNRGKFKLTQQNNFYFINIFGIYFYKKKMEHLKVILKHDVKWCVKQFHYPSINILG